MKFINMKRVALTVIALLIAAPTTASANGIPQFVYLVGTDGVTRVIEINTNEEEGMITDVNIFESYSDALVDPGCDNPGCPSLNNDSFDDFGAIGQDEDYFNEDYLTEDESFSVGSWNNSTNSFSISSSGATVQVSMAENYIEFTLTKADAENLWIGGDLGSDEDTTWVDGNTLYSWEVDAEDGVGDDPILRWEHNGNNFYSEDGEDRVDVGGSNSITLRIYMYAHSNPDQLDADTYMSNFQEWVNENVARTDIFTGVSQRPTALVYGNPNSYSDPDGELRKLINRIKGLSGSLIGWK